MGSCYYHHSEDSRQLCAHCEKPLCERCIHGDYPAFCWSCGLDHGNGNLAKKSEPFVLPVRLSFVKTRSFAISCIVVAALLILYGTYEATLTIKANQFKQKMTGIRFDGIHLFMSREEVSDLYGLGTDKTAGCFGCEMNFIYPKQRLSGRYSETLNTLPLVKKMTTADPSNTVFGIKVGDSFDTADDILVEQGFSAEGTERVYVKGLYYIQLWNDGYLHDFDKGKGSERTDGIIRSITVGYWVKSDEQIQY